LKDNLIKAVDYGQKLGTDYIEVRAQRLIKTFLTTEDGIVEVTEIAIPVGGISVPVNKLSLLAPYIGLTILLAVAAITVGYIKKRKRRTGIIS